MESYIKIQATVTMPDGTTQKAEFTTHALTYNYKLVSDPPGLPIIIEEFVCLESPCITSQMAKTNPGFAAQNVQVFEDEVYKFDHWVATNVNNGKKKQVKATLYEETADADYVVQANYNKVTVKDQDATMGIPAGVVAQGDLKRVALTWNPPAPGADAPDFIIIAIKDPTGAVVKSHMTTAAKGQVVLALPVGINTYTVETSWFNSPKATRGARSAPVAFTTTAELTKGKPACLAGTQFAEVKIKSPKDGMGEKYQIGILGTYPMTLRKGQKVRLTFGVVSETATSLMVNVLNKNDFTWVAGKVVQVPAKTDKVMDIEFTVEQDIKNKEEYFIDALLVMDVKDYTTAFVEDTSAGKIMGIAKPIPGAAAAANAAAAAQEAAAAAAAADVAPPAGAAAGAADPAGPGVMPAGAAPAVVAAANP